MVIIGIVCILMFPFTAREVFTSENALSVETIEPKLG
jgi:hypothetical protein